MSSQSRRDRPVERERTLMMPFSFGPVWPLTPQPLSPNMWHAHSSTGSNETLPQVWGEGGQTLVALVAHTALLACASEVISNALLSAWPAEWLERDLALSAAHPLRVMANAVTLTSWRNGIIEKVHAGRSNGYAFDERHGPAG